MTASIDFKCPNCACELSAKRTSVGKRVKCPECEQKVRVPGPEVPLPRERGRSSRHLIGSSGLVFVSAGVGIYLGGLGLAGSAGPLEYWLLAGCGTLFLGLSLLVTLLLRGISEGFGSVVFVIGLILLLGGLGYWKVWAPSAAEEELFTNWLEAMDKSYDAHLAIRSKQAARQARPQVRQLVENARSLMVEVMEISPRQRSSLRWIYHNRIDLSERKSSEVLLQHWKGEIHLLIAIWIAENGQLVIFEMGE